MITGAHLASMKEGAAFINTARGAVVNEPEMIAVLQQRPDLYALLDVTSPGAACSRGRLFTACPTCFSLPISPARTTPNAC